LRVDGKNAMNIEHPTSNAQHPMRDSECGVGGRGCCGWSRADTAAVRRNIRRGRSGRAAIEGRSCRAGCPTERAGSTVPPGTLRALVGFCGAMSGWRMRYDGQDGTPRYQAQKSAKSGRNMVGCAALRTFAQLNAAWRRGSFCELADLGMAKGFFGSPYSGIFRHIPPYSALFRLLLGRRVFQSQVRCRGFEDGRFWGCGPVRWLASARLRSLGGAGSGERNGEGQIGEAAKRDGGVFQFQAQGRRFKSRIYGQKVVRWLTLARHSPAWLAFARLFVGQRKLEAVRLCPIGAREGETARIFGQKTAISQGCDGIQIADDSRFCVFGNETHRTGLYPG